MCTDKRSKQLNELGVDCNTIAYPYCLASDSAITAKYYIAARNCQQEIAPPTPKDYYNIPAIFRDAVLYSKERDAVSVIEKQHTKSKIDVEITDTLDNTVYNIPLTIRRPLPTDWKKVAVKQNDQVIPSNITTINQAKFIVFDAIPDKGTVSIEWQ